MTTLEAAESMSQTIYAFIQAYVAEQGYPPTLREISAVVHLAPSGVAHYLDKLEAKGRLTRQPGQARGIKLQGGKSEQMSEQMFHTFPGKRVTMPSSASGD